MVKYFTYKSWKVITVLFKIFLGISASTHWVVTENGKIQSQLDSAFHMRRPYDLLSLLEQEQRAAEIDRLYREMVRRKVAIDTEWAGLESASELEARLYSSDPDCLQAGRPLSDSDLYTPLADDGVGRPGLDLELLIPRVDPIDTADATRPDCEANLELDFTLRTFPHLQVLSWNLSAAPHPLPDLPSLTERSPRQLAAALVANHTSWFAHNAAALYWRTQGDARRALECAKRAVYLAPRQYRDLALFTLGCVVHHARCPAEAAILLHAAVDHAPHQPTAHLALANVYAILGDYNRSIACYDNALRLRPDWATALWNRYSVVCHHKLESSLYQLHRSLQGILGELHHYHSLQEQWLKQQEQLMYQQAPLEVKLQSLQHEPLTALLSHKGDKCVPQSQDGETVVSCDSKLLAHHLQIDITMSLQMLLKNVEAQAQKISEQMSRRLLMAGDTELHQPEHQSAEHSEGEGDLDEGDGSLEIFVETVIDEAQDSVEEDRGAEPSSPSQFSLYKHPKLQSLKDVGVKMMGFMEDLVKRQKIGQPMLPPEQHCKTSNFNTDGCTADTNQWLLPTTDEDVDRQSKVLPIAQSLGLLEEGSWLRNTSSHVIATLIITCIQLSQWDSSEIPSSSEKPECCSVPNPLAELSKEHFRPISPEPRLRSVLHSLLLDDGASPTDFTKHLAHSLKVVISAGRCSGHEPSSSWLLETTAALYWRCEGDAQRMLECLQAAVYRAPPHMKDIPLHHVTHISVDKSRHEPSSSWLLETTAALYWRCEGDAQRMLACLQAAVYRAPPHMKDIPLHHVAHILLTLGHREEALLLANLSLKMSPQSINAHMVLFHTYLALGEPENAMKYGKASLALYQQSQAATPSSP